MSWDPRGIGKSTAVQCFDTPDEEGQFLGNLDAFPVGSEREQRWISTYTAFGQKCAERNGALLQHVSTVDTARDLDLLRQAVGDGKLSYYGVSYGTFLCATYANLFPDRIRGMILDGNVSPTRGPTPTNPPPPPVSTPGSAATSAPRRPCRIC